MTLPSSGSGVPDLPSINISSCLGMHKVSQDPAAEANDFSRLPERHTYCTADFVPSGEPLIGAPRGNGRAATG
jgi:hypothetical protein